MLAGCLAAGIANRPRESFEEAALLIIQVCRKDYLRLGVKISTLIRLSQVRHALPTQTERLAIGGTLRDTQHESAPVVCHNAHFTTEHRRHQGNLYLCP